MLSFSRCCKQLAGQQWRLEAGADRQLHAHQHTRRVTQPFGRQIHPWDTLACCWNVKQPTKHQKTTIANYNQGSTISATAAPLIMSKPLITLFTWWLNLPLNNHEKRQNSLKCTQGKTKCKATKRNEKTQVSLLVYFLPLKLLDSADRTEQHTRSTLRGCWGGHKVLGLACLLSEHDAHNMLEYEFKSWSGLNFPSFVLSL